MKITCIAVDDEPLALQLLTDFIVRTNFLELKASFGSTAEALIYLSENEIDCVFLDIEMPDLNGIELTQVLSKFARRPKIIFVTAYSRYAVKGLEMEAAAFLLKPYGLSELQAAAQTTADLIMKRKEQSSRDLFIKIDAQQVRLKTSEVILIESMRDYVKIYTEGRDVPYIPLMTLKKIKSILPPQDFVQINRSQLIALRRVTAYTKTTVELGGRRFVVTETFQQEFLDKMVR